jgi:hypothetical protein
MGAVILPGMGRGTMRSKVQGAACGAPTPLRQSLTDCHLPVPERINH